MPSAGDHGMAGVVAALVAHHHVGLLGQQVNDPALALVAPVEAGDSSQHDASSLLFWSTTAWTRVGRAVELDEAGGVRLMVAAAASKVAISWL